MQYTFRIDDRNSITFQLKLSDAGSTEYSDGPEVIAAVITNESLSDISKDDLIGLAGQIVDHLTASVMPAIDTQDDWRERFRAGKL